MTRRRAPSRRHSGRAAAILAVVLAAVAPAGIGLAVPRQAYDEQQLGSAPAPRPIWSFLESRVPAVITERVDVGGSETGTQALFSARATGWRQNVFTVDGIESTDPAVRGTSVFHYDLGALRRVALRSGGHPASVASPGVAIDLVLKGGADRAHFVGRGHFAVDALQADSLEVGAIGAASSRIDVLSDVAVQAGGPLAPGRIWLFGAYRDARISRPLPRFDESVRTAAPLASVKLSSRRSRGGEWSVSYVLQPYENPARGAAVGVDPAATLVEDSRAQLLGGRWSRSLGDGSLVAIRGGVLDYNLPLDLQAGATRPSRLDIVTGLRQRAAALSSASSRRRYSFDVDAAAEVEAGGFDHALAAGLQYGLAPTRTELRANGDLNLVTSGGDALVAQLLNTPVDSRQRVRDLGIFVQDDLGRSGRWSARFGVRFDDHDGSLPPQDSPAGSFAPARSFAPQDGLLAWRGIAPRAEIAFDIFGDNRALATLGYAGYVHRLSASTLGFANPNALGVSVVPWVDSNGDGEFGPGEGGPPTSVAGAPFGAVDRALVAPRTRELRAGLAYEIGDGWRGAVGLWYRKDSELLEDVEVGLKLSDFEQTIVIDPGRDNLVGTADDRGISVFNQVESFGANRLLLTSDSGKSATYRGIDFELRRSDADNWQLAAHLTLGLAEGLAGKTGPVPGDSGVATDLFNDPNAALNADARLFWDRPWVLKVAGAYRLPHGFDVAASLRSWAGAPIARILPVPLNQGLVDVFVEPRGALRGDALTTLDVSLAKSLPVGENAELQLVLDVFNALNAATVIGTDETVPRFGTPTRVVPPLVARLGARITF